MGSGARAPRSSIRACIGLGAGILGLCACGGDPVYVLGRLPGSVGSGAEIDSGFSAGGSVGAGGVAPDDAAGGAAPGDGAGGAAPDEDGAPDAGCAAPLPLRDYVFTGSGTELVDRRGGAPGVIHGGAALDGSGELTLDGDDDYFDLPDGLLAGLDQVTVVAWISHLGGPAYTRIFDFGIGNHGEDPAEGLNTVGVNYLALTPMTGFVPRYMAALISAEGAAGEIAAVTERRLDDALQMVGVAASPRTLDVFHDGALIARVPSSVPLSSIENLNNWLGRSQYDQDPYLHASYAGFQVYAGALAECAIRTLYAAGPTR